MLRSVSLAVVLISSLSVAACATDGGTAQISAAAPAGYYAADYDNGYYGDPYGWRAVPYGFVGVGYGWNDGLYYPGSGADVFDRAGKRRAATPAQRNFWKQQRRSHEQAQVDSNRTERDRPPGR